MLLKLIALYCALSVIGDSKAFVRRYERSAESPSPNDLVESFQRNLEQFKNCIDQTLSKAVGQVQEKQLQPVLNVVGDSLFRVSKAFGDLTGSTTKSPDLFNFK